MEELTNLERLTKEQLKQIALGLGVKKFSALKKAELIEAINTRREEMRKEEEEKKREERKRVHPGDVSEVEAVLDVMEEGGFGFLRYENYLPSKRDVYVSPSQIRRFNLKTGDMIRGDVRTSHDDDKYSPLLFVKAINGDPIDVAIKRRAFEKLTPIYPTERLNLDTGDMDMTASRLINLIAPIGKGQRGMIVAPPKAGKTTIIKQVAKSIMINYPDIYLIVLLIDERPEEVTDIRRYIGDGGEVIASTFDQQPDNHCKVSEMVLSRAQRLVEQQKDVVILMDSITRLARAYNQTVTPTGRTLSGGLDPDALHAPKKFFGAARNIENGGSLTILATALVETGSRMDDVIFEEFKGTGNMELKLDRSLQERRIFPAIDIAKSSTRREEDLLTKKERAVLWSLRRDAKTGADTLVTLLKFLKNTKNNDEFIEVFLKTAAKQQPVV